MNLSTGQSTWGRFLKSELSSKLMSHTAALFLTFTSCHHHVTTTRFHQAAESPSTGIVEGVNVHLTYISSCFASCNWGIRPDARFHGLHWWGWVTQGIGIHTRTEWNPRAPCNRSCTHIGINSAFHLHDRQWPDYQQVGGFAFCY